ncbi:hypothetical protein D3C81_1987900 [compost metagenome]
MPLGAGSNALQIGAGAGLGHGNSTDQFATRQARKIAVLLLLGTVVEDVVGDDGMNGGGHARQPTPSHLVIKERFVAEVTSPTAVLAGQVHTQQAEFAGTTP